MIHIAGQSFPAHTCKTCGARDSNPELLAIHEARHKIMGEVLAGRAGVHQRHRGYRRVKAFGRCLDCGQVGKLVKGRCQRDYARHRKASASK